MMFDVTSRYYNIKAPKMDISVGDGTRRAVRYVQRRIIPPADTSVTIIEHTVIESDRVDTIAARYLGDPTQFWLICDVNNVLCPNDLTDIIGRVIKIAQPQV